MVYPTIRGEERYCLVSCTSPGGYRGKSWSKSNAVMHTCASSVMPRKMTFSAYAVRNSSQSGPERTRSEGTASVSLAWRPPQWCPHPSSCQVAKFFSYISSGVTALQVVQCGVAWHHNHLLNLVAFDQLGQSPQGKALPALERGLARWRGGLLALPLLNAKLLRRQRHERPRWPGSVGTGAAR